MNVRPYLLSFATGALIGLVYRALHVRSPAPPIVALLGLLGIVLGEGLPELWIQRHAQAVSPPPGPGAPRLPQPAAPAAGGELRQQGQPLGKDSA